MTERIAFRPITDQDLDFLQHVYASTRADEMKLVPWSDQEKQDFLRMQFDAQHACYQQQFPAAQFDIVMEGQQPIGRLYVDRRQDEFRIIDIALLAEYRGRGIGGSIMNSVLAEAAAADKPVRIHVEQNNPALRLYERLGFCKLEDKGVYWLMEWQETKANRNEQLRRGER